MLNPKSPEEVLKSIFPLLLVVIALVGAIIFLPNLQQINLDERSRASEITPVISPRDTVQRDTVTPDVVCSSLYSPVCGSDSKTYSNSCEANLAKITNFTPGECDTPTLLPNSN